MTRSLISLFILLVAAPASGEPAPGFEITIDVDRAPRLDVECSNGVVDQTDLSATLAVCDAWVAEAPEDGDAYYYRGFNHYYLDDYAAAEADFSEAIRLETRHLAKAYFQRGTCKEKRRALREASLDFRKAHELSPDWAAARRKVEDYAWAYD